MRTVLWMGGVCVAAGLAAAGCQPIETHNVVEVQQSKPIEININLSGKLELVITDARNDLQTITGEKPKREVRPEDIGLPPSGTPGSRGAEVEGQAVALLMDLPAAGGTQHARTVATDAELVKSMAERNAKVRALLSAKAAGEAHTGLLVEKGKATADQAAVVAAENADRSALYKLRAATNKTTVEEAGLAYYLQRLGYAEKGDWVEKYNKATKKWEWVEWEG